MNEKEQKEVEENLTKSGAKLTQRKSGLTVVKIDTEDEKKEREDREWPGQYL